MNFEALGGVAVGIGLIVFRNSACALLQKSYEKFPKYEEGVKSVRIKFSIRPIFIIVLGIIVLMFSLVGLLQTG